MVLVVKTQHLKKPIDGKAVPNAGYVRTKYSCQMPPSLPGFSGTALPKPILFLHSDSRDLSGNADETRTQIAEHEYLKKILAALGRRPAVLSEARATLSLPKGRKREPKDPGNISRTTTASGNSLECFFPVRAGSSLKFPASAWRGRHRGDFSAHASVATLPSAFAQDWAGLGMLSPADCRPERQRAPPEGPLGIFPVRRQLQGILLNAFSLFGSDRR